MKKIIKLFDPFIGKEEEHALTHTLKSHFWAYGLGLRYGLGLWYGPGL